MKIIVEIKCADGYVYVDEEEVCNYYDKEFYPELIPENHGNAVSVRIYTKD